MRDALPSKSIGTVKPIAVFLLWTENLRGKHQKMNMRQENISAFTSRHSHLHLTHNFGDKPKSFYGLMIFVSVLFGKFQPGLPILHADEWLASSQCFCHQLLLFSVVYPFHVCYLVHTSGFSLQDIPNGCPGYGQSCAMALMDFPSSLSYTIVSFSIHRQFSGFHVGYTSN